MVRELDTSEHPQTIIRGSIYDPAGDLRFQSLLQWAEVIEGTRRRIDSGVDAGMRFILLPVESLFSAKDHATSALSLRQTSSTFSRELKAEMRK